MKSATLPLSKKNSQNSYLKTGLVIFLSVWQLLLFGQIQQENGDLLLMNGEMKHGFINYISDQTVANIFIIDSLGAKKYYDLKDVKNIMLLSCEKYITRKFGTEKDSSVMLFKALIESPKLSLYERFENGSNYYYVSKEDLLYKLENNKMIITSDHKTQCLKQDYKYIRILGSLMADSMNLVSKLKYVKLEENDLRTAISEYNKGIATYYWKRNPNWMIFTQYNHYGSYMGTQILDGSYGFNAGLQYYVSKKSRSSFKFSVNYATYHIDNDDDGTAISLSTSWQYDFIRTEYYNFNFQMHIMDISAISSKSTDRRGIVTTEHNILPIPRLSPAVGLEIMPFSRVIILLEINNLIQTSLIGRSYSIGVKYDLGEKYW